MDGEGTVRAGGWILRAVRPLKLTALKDVCAIPHPDRHLDVPVVNNDGNGEEHFSLLSRLPSAHLHSQLRANPSRPAIILIFCPSVSLRDTWKYTSTQVNLQCECETVSC